MSGWLRSWLLAGFLLVVLGTGLSFHAAWRHDHNSENPFDQPSAALRLLAQNRHPNVTTERNTATAARDIGIAAFAVAGVSALARPND